MSQTVRLLTYIVVLDTPEIHGWSRQQVLAKASRRPAKALEEAMRSRDYTCQAPLSNDNVVYIVAESAPNDVGREVGLAAHALGIKVSKTMFRQVDWDGQMPAGQSNSESEAFAQ